MNRPATTTNVVVLWTSATATNGARQANLTAGGACWQSATAPDALRPAADLIGTKFACKLSFSLQNSQLCHLGRVRAAGGQRAAEIVMRPLGIKLAGVLLNGGAGAWRKWGVRGHRTF